MKNLPKKNEHRALLITSGGLGDTLLKLPVIRFLKEQNPNLIWDALGHPEWLEIGRHRFYFNRVFSVDGPFVYCMISPDSEPPASIVAFYRQYEKILSYHMVRNTVFYDRLMKAGVTDVYRKAFPPPENSDCHVVDYLLEDFCDSSFVPIRDAPEVFLRKNDYIFARRWFEQHTSSGHPRILIHPGSGSQEKALNPALCISLISRIRDAWKNSPIIGFGPADGWLHDCVQNSILSTLDWIPLHDQTVIQYASVLACCDGYIGVDSGISHLASALKVPSVVLFGPSNPHLWRPPGKTVHILSPGQAMFGSSEKILLRKSVSHCMAACVEETLIILKRLLLTCK